MAYVLLGLQFISVERGVPTQTTSLLNSEKWPHNDVELDWCPSESPTFPYADTTSKNMANTWKD